MFPDSSCFFSMETLPRLFIVIFGCSALLASCDSFEPPVVPFGQTDELVVLTVNSPDTYYENAEGAYAGLEHDLASEFALHLGMTVRFKTASNLEKALGMLEKHRGHLVAGLSITPKRALRAKFGPVYQLIQPQVAYNTHYRKPKDIDQLVEKIVQTPGDSAHAEALNKVKQQIPEFEWRNVDLSAEELLARLAEGKIDYVVADSTQINLAKNFYPNIGVAFGLGDAISRAWAFSPFADRELLQETQRFFERIEKDGTLARLLDRYYGHRERLHHTDVRGILAKRQTRLPELRNYFHEAEELSGIDWRLIAALAYQESHWDHLATSPRNVRGVMMLTEVTADRMKVTDRLDPKQSIIGGARYLALLKDRLPTRIREPDRTWIALAAYNQGPSHIEDARILAERMNLDPDSWIDLKKTLPLLSERKYFQDLKHGYARGGEAVILTESVRTYYEILLKYERPYSWGFPAVVEKGGCYGDPFSSKFC
jgi:membrane-bound lytic murein transglycosylase F